MRLLFLGSPPFAVPVLRHLLASAHQVLALITPPDRPRGRGRSVQASPLVEMARAAGIEVVQPQGMRDPELLKQLRALEAEVMLVASYGEILRQDVLDMAPAGALNVHGSLLPRWRGASPIQRAIIAGDAESGVSIQRMVLALDEGDVLLEERTLIGPQENAGDLFARLAEIGGGAAVRALDMIATGSAVYTAQDPACATYARKLRKEDGFLDLTNTAQELDQLIRGVTPWPGARLMLNAERALVVVRAQAHAEEDLDDAGRALDAGLLIESKRRLLVRCGQGALELERVKPAGKGEMDGAAFLLGARLGVGNKLTG